MGSLVLAHPDVVEIGISQCKLLTEVHERKKLHLMLNATKSQEISPRLQGEASLLAYSRNQQYVPNTESPRLRIDSAHFHNRTMMNSGVYPKITRNNSLRMVELIVCLELGYDPIS